ncbi:MAG TPA: tetratricopeptide repeat protein, partial [Terriglobia bacterium]|nr:tetratricopeptide repeat protein [Terriglobia bacterium]
DRGDYGSAIPILSEALTQRPTPDVYLNLGIAYRHTRDWQKAEDTLTEGTERFPDDPRLPTELANAYIGAGDVDGARNALHRALRIDPTNVNAANLIAAIELSEGEVQTALRVWNRSDNPIVDKVLHNSNPAFGHWTVREANAFHPGKVMTYRQWRTTQLRLLETGIFSNVGIEVEPSPTSSRYNPIILTSGKSNDLANLAFGIVKGALIETTYLDFWNIENSGITVNSKYRWDYNRKRGEVQFHAPVPVPGILFLSATGLWRSERWDLTRILQTDAGVDDRFDFKSTGARVEFKYIPHYRFDFGGGFEYTNRAVKGGLTPLVMDSRNSGKVLFQGSIRLADGRYRNRLHVEGSVARKNIMGDLKYTTVTAEMNHQFLVSKEANTVLVWKLKGGISRGQLPVEEYFVLGLDSHSGNLLRAHPVASHGHYGNAPMGTSFGLSNMSIERRLAILPLFNTLNLPFLDVKAQAFLDGGKTFDRANIFKEGKLYVDTGAGLKFETPTHSFNLIYGKSLRDGRNVLFAYIEKRW